jgi:hypothetical protein
MSRPSFFSIVLVIAVVLIVAWVARHTEWGEVQLPTSLQGEAARNPFYAAQRLVDVLGASSERAQRLGALDDAAVVVLSTWGWDVNAARRAEFERWVESGGRLVADAALISGSDAFERWSGIERVRKEPDEEAEEEDVFQTPEVVEPCEDLLELRYAADDSDADEAYYEGCGFDRTSWLITTQDLAWALSGDDGLQAARVAVGKGSVTVINAVPFLYRDVLEGDHGELLIAATQLRAGDHVVFMSEEDYPSLPELVWRYGAPVVVVAFLWIALALWRGAVRFGPLVAVRERARRSLGEQILGTGRFTVRLGGGAALTAAAARALHEVAARRISGYERLSSGEQVASVARLASVSVAELGAAVNPATNQRVPELRSALALLESARRQLISRSQGSKHGKRI